MTPFHPSSCAVTESASSIRELPVLENGFQLLASMFRYPDEPIWQALAETLPEAEIFSSSLLGRPLTLPPQQSLEQTYTALFCTNPIGLTASPYLSSYLKDSVRIEGDGRLMVQQLLAEEGVDAGQALKEPEDHLATVLELAGVLCRKAHGDDPAEAADGRIRLLQLTDTMLIMLPPFQSAITTADFSCVDFYVDAVTLCLCLTVLCREKMLLG